MRLPVVAAALTLTAACGESATGPYTPSGPPPSGLAASLQITPFYETSTPAPSVTVAGDSVVTAAVLSSGCREYAAQAGRDGGALVVTLVSTPYNGPCLAGMFSSTFRVAVAQVPRGRYAVVLRQRFESPTQASQEIEVVRRSVSLP